MVKQYVYVVQGVFSETLHQQLECAYQQDLNDPNLRRNNEKIISWMKENEIPEEMVEQACEDDLCGKPSIMTIMDELYLSESSFRLEESDLKGLLSIVLQASNPKMAMFLVQLYYEKLCN